MILVVFNEFFVEKVARSSGKFTRHRIIMRTSAVGERRESFLNQHE